MPATRSSQTGSLLAAGPSTQLVRIISLPNQATAALSLPVPLFYGNSIFTWFFLLEKNVQAKKMDNNQEGKSNTLISSLHPHLGEKE